MSVAIRELSPDQRLEVVGILRARFEELSRDPDWTLARVAELLADQPEGGHWSPSKVAENLGLKDAATPNGARRRCSITRRNAERFARALHLDPVDLDV